MRLGEREVLEWVATWFESRKGQLKDLAYYQVRFTS